MGSDSVTVWEYPATSNRLHKMRALLSWTMTSGGLLKLEAGQYEGSDWLHLNLLAALYNFKISDAMFLIAQKVNNSSHWDFECLP